MRSIHDVPPKVMAILVHGIEQKVGAFDNLPAIIQACGEWARDPWVPEGRRAQLVSMLKAATKELADVQAALGSSGGSSGPRS